MNYENSNKKHDLNEKINNGAESNPASDSSRYGNKQQTDEGETLLKESNSPGSNFNNSSKSNPADMAVGTGSNKAVSALKEDPQSLSEKLVKITDKAIVNNRMRTLQVIDQNDTEEKLIKNVSQSLHTFISQDDSIWLVMGEMVWLALQKIERQNGGAFKKDSEGKGVKATLNKIAVKINEHNITKTNISKNIKNLADTLYEYSRIYGKLIGDVASKGSNETIRSERTVLFEKYSHLHKSYCREAITRTNPAEALEIAIEELKIPNNDYSVEKFKKSIKHISKLNPSRSGGEEENLNSTKFDLNLGLTKKAKKSLNFLKITCKESEEKIIEEALQAFEFLKVGISKNKLTLLSSN